MTSTLEPPSRGGKTTLQTAERALAFLEAVALASHPPRVKDVTSALRVNPTTGYHLLNTLEKAGYVRRDEDGTLRIGARIAVLHESMLRHLSLGKDLQPIVDDLRARTNETAYAAVLTDDGVVIQALAEANQAVKVSGLHIGFGGAEHIRASGRAVLAHLEFATRQVLLERRLGSAATPRVQEFEQQFSAIRERGWAIDDGDFQPGVCCVAAPFFRPGGHVAGSVALSVPSTRYPEASSAIIDAVLNASAAASAALGSDSTGISP
jgi:IclR family transcriptional regulator, acetate operon repressor